MMRPVTVHVGSERCRRAPVLTFTRGSVILDWTDGTPVDYTNPTTWGNAQRTRSATASNGLRWLATARWAPTCRSAPRSPT